MLGRKYHMYSSCACNLKENILISISPIRPAMTLKSDLKFCQSSCFRVLNVTLQKVEVEKVTFSSTEKSADSVTV